MCQGFSKTSTWKRLRGGEVTKVAVHSCEPNRDELDLVCVNRGGMSDVGKVKEVGRQHGGIDVELGRS